MNGRRGIVAKADSAALHNVPVLRFVALMMRAYVQMEMVYLLALTGQGVLLPQQVAKIQETATVEMSRKRTILVSLSVSVGITMVISVCKVTHLHLPHSYLVDDLRFLMVTGDGLSMRLKRPQNAPVVGYVIVVYF